MIYIPDSCFRSKPCSLSLQLLDGKLWTPQQRWWNGVQATAIQMQSAEGGQRLEGRSRTVGSATKHAPVWQFQYRNSNLQQRDTAGREKEPCRNQLKAGNTLKLTRQSDVIPKDLFLGLTPSLSTNTNCHNSSWEVRSQWESFHVGRFVRMATDGMLTATVH